MFVNRYPLPVLALLAGIIIIASCMSLPDADIASRETVAMATSLEIKDADGRLSESKAEEVIEKAAADPDTGSYLKQLVKIEQTVTGEALTAGNHVELLVDGPAAYKAMFEAMTKAEDHIHLETYILADDEIGQRLAGILLERLRAGVKVAIIYDDLGSAETSDEYFERLQAAGVELFRFHPVNPVDDLRIWRINQRNHRKILIVDGRVAFTGGMNISGVYSSSSFSKPRKARDTDDGWRDTQIRIEGPAVADFQRLFLETWAENDEGPSLDHHNNFPKLDEAGEELVRVVPNIGGDDDYDIYETYLAAISHARWRLWITQAYFTPDERLLKALKDAAGRGVDVRVLLPGFTDSTLVLHASHDHYTELLEAGVKIYERQDALLHAKTAVIDGVWSTVGSSNFDYRSFLHNNEANAVILGREFGRQMEELFKQDLELSEEVKLSEWKKRPLWKRAKERASSLFDYWI